MSIGNTNPSTPSQKDSGFFKWIEIVGNKLPHPFMLFVYLCVIIIVVSALLSHWGLSVIHPGDGETVPVKSLLSTEGFHWAITNMITNFTEFPPLGLVLCMVLGIGLAEKVGLIQAVLRKMILNVPSSIVSFAIVFAGILGNLASDAAMIIIPPLGAMVFLALGRHPLAGLAAGMAGAGSGFTANFFIAGTDALLSGISTKVAQTINPNLTVTPLDNWYFMSASVLVLALLGTWITDKVVEPRLGAYRGDEKATLENLTAQENRALKVSGIVAVLFVGLVALTVVPEGALLRNPETGDILDSPFIKGIIPIILFFFIAVSVTYGLMLGKIKTQRDVPQLMGEAIKDMSSFIVLIFTAAQFIAYFEWTNMGLFLAVNGADLLMSLNMTGLPVLIAFILLTAVLNLFITSGSAQWALMAPVFIPMLMLMDYNPAFIQLAYRVADSSTNTITPMSPYMPMMLAYISKYQKNSGIGTVISLMMPYALLFLGIWIVMIIAWYLIGLPLGPGVPVR
ncbi:AbgT family transporter [Desmospora activa]|uniref:Aminobenzoyl-glutamate transport protein n=1 Tax=Desmospora activa DSM 45169 TaxID=1121389 RepID=A0A2T4ZAY8_9BACL|nr:AbgT family transporter [Desmospora activa]PTM59052.1 aminobenzoyl-glutamate transport protein [Desmospora activa DSM 45169]